MKDLLEGKLPADENLFEAKQLPKLESLFAHETLKDELCKRIFVFGVAGGWEKHPLPAHCSSMGIGETLASLSSNFLAALVGDQTRRDLASIFNQKISNFFASFIEQTKFS